MSTIKRALRAMLFLREKPDTNREPTKTVGGTTILIMLRREHGTPLKVYQRLLLSTYANRLSAVKASLGYSVFKQLHTLPNSRSLLNTLVSTRSHKAVKFFCNLAGVKPPPYFESSKRPYYDAILELGFEGSIDAEQTATIKQLMAELEGCSELVHSIECDKRHTILETGRRQKNAVNLVTVCKNPWNKTMEETQTYWRNVHGPLVADHQRHTRMQSYDQYHATRNPDSVFDKRYNGIASIRYDSAGSFTWNSMKPKVTRFNSTIVVDEIYVTVKSHFLMMKEHTIVPQSVDCRQE